MSVTFSTGFHTIKPGLRVSGDEISVVFTGVYDSGIYAGKKYIHIDLTNEPDLTFVEAGVAGPLETIPNVDALYNQLKDAGMTEAFDGFLVDPSDLSIVSVSDREISFDFSGHAPYVFSRNPDANVTDRVKVAHQTWSLPQAEFSGATTLFATVESPEEVEFQSIEDRLNLEADQLDQLIASGMWLFATQADFPPASENHGRVVHSHADGAVFFSHAGAWHQIAKEDDLQTAIDSLAGEALAREGADNTLQAAIDVNTTGLATEINQRQAGDTATLSSANSYTDTKVSELIDGAGPALDTLKELGDALSDNDDDIAALVTAVGNAQSAADANTTGLATEINQRQAGDNALSGRLDVLEADPITNAEVVAIANDLQANRMQGDHVLRVDFEADDAALSARIDVLEADPTTQAALDAEVTARTSGDSALDTRVTALEGNVAITDPTTAAAVAAVQSDVDANQTASESADAALSGRLDVLEADPTTQTLLTAETTAREEGDLNAIGQSNAYTDGLLNQYLGGAADEEKSNSYTAVIQAGFTPTVDATAGQFKFNNADVASVTAIAINHDSSAGRIDWFEVFPTGSVLRVTRASDSAVFDFTVTQAGVGGVNSRTKNFTVTTSSTGTLADGDSLSISTVGGPDIATGGDLDVAGKVAVAGSELSTFQGDVQIGNITNAGALSVWKLQASTLSRFGMTTGAESVVDVSHTSYLDLKTDNTSFANEYVTVRLTKGEFSPLKDSTSAVYMDLGHTDRPWKTLHVQNIQVANGINASTVSVSDAGTFASSALPDGVSFADLMEAIGDALVARPKLDGSNIPGPYNNDTEASAGGVSVGGIYKNSNGTIHWRVS
nr:hypothetical protein 27 [bacterium]